MIASFAKSMPASRCAHRKPTAWHLLDDILNRIAFDKYADPAR